MSAPPPPEIRATWKLVIIVEPNEKLPGSTSVACWLVELVKVSVLSLTSGVVAGGNPAPKLDPLLELGPGLSPQPTELATTESASANTAHVAIRKRNSPFTSNKASPTLPGEATQVNCRLDAARGLLT